MPSKTVSSTAQMRAALLAAAFTALLASGAAGADTANIQVNGDIAAGTCELAAGDVNRTVTLDTVSVKDMPASGKASAGAKNFTLTVLNCDPGLTTATFTFAGTPDATDGLRYRNTGTAKGVAIELESADGQTIGANGTNNARASTITGDQATLDLNVSYWHLPGVALSSGSVRAVATVEVTYN